jgi:hypothetical protein
MTLHSSSRQQRIAHHPHRIRLVGRRRQWLVVRLGSATSRTIFQPTMRRGIEAYRVLRDVMAGEAARPSRQ